MADINLTQADADALIAMEKHRATDEQTDFPVGGESKVLPLQSADKRERFLLDLSRGRINLQKVKMQTRGRQVVVLVRLDLGRCSTSQPGRRRDTSAPSSRLSRRLRRQVGYTCSSRSVPHNRRRVDGT